MPIGPLTGAFYRPADIQGLSAGVCGAVWTVARAPGYDQNEAFCFNEPPSAKRPRVSSRFLFLFLFLPPHAMKAAPSPTARKMSR
ncbi:unnamed protein product [Gadus morhua 'NCC']